MTAEAFAPAKINLTLHVTGRRADGLHLLDSLVVFADVGDRVTVTPAPDWSLAVTGPMAAGVPCDDTNLVLRAARLAGGAPCAITLDKHLPTASGIGGGSSDAAACLRALHRLDGRGVPSGLERLGADVPVCLRATPRRMRGIGDLLEDVPPLPPLWAVLTNPGEAVSTSAVFGALARVGTEAQPRDVPGALPQTPEDLKQEKAMRWPQSWGNAALFATWLEGQRNDLEPPACRILPDIGRTLARLRGLDGALLARMSGSGATCFALFAGDAAARSAADRLRALAPDHWIATARLGAPTL